MDLSVNRVEFDSLSTVGEFYAQDDRLGWTLELPNSDGRPGSCIPQGRYPVVFSPSHKFSLSSDPWVLHYSAMMPHIIRIPDRTDIMIHWGNDPHDTNGCVLVGLNHPKDDFITSSRAAFDKLWLLIETPARTNNCWINIKGGARGLPDQAPGLETDITA